MRRGVLVTGGSRGIGRAIVKRFCEAGYAVAFTYLNSASAAEELARECGALAIKADSASEADIIRAVETAREALGSIDVLVNNAAISSFSLLTDVTLDEWNSTLAVNLTAPFLYSREVSRGMIRAQWGRIINISSMWGLVGSSMESVYSATKAGLIGLTKALAKELGPSGITVNAVAPGVIKTDMNSALTPEVLDILANDTPVCRLGEPEEVAYSVLFLAGEDSAFITGAILNVSGGYVV